MKKQKMNKEALNDVLMWLLLIIVFTAAYLIGKSDGFRFLLYIMVLMWGVDRFVEWIGDR